MRQPSSVRDTFVSSVPTCTPFSYTRKDALPAVCADAHVPARSTVIMTRRIAPIVISVRLVVKYRAFAYSWLPPSGGRDGALTDSIRRWHRRRLHAEDLSRQSLERTVEKLRILEEENARTLKLIAEGHGAILDSHSATLDSP